MQKSELDYLPEVTLCAIRAARVVAAGRFTHNDAMDERFKLIFRGEVLDGQHPAVVKKRLQALMKVSDERADTLFAGKPVVLRKDADTATAARFKRRSRKPARGFVS